MFPLGRDLTAIDTDSDVRSQMSVHLNSVDLSAQNNIRTVVVNGNLLYAAKVKLLCCLPPVTEWTELHLGYLALSSTPEKLAFLTLVDCNDFSVLMIHELYYQFHKSYQRLCPTVYAFPSDTCLIGIQFLKDHEAKEMERQIQSASLLKSRKSSIFQLLRIGRTKVKMGSVVSMPAMDTGQEVSVEWDAEQGYRVAGSFSDLPEEHKQFMLEHGFMSEKT
jgi:hypothetical protein